MFSDEFNNLYKFSPAGVALVDEQGCFVEINDTFAAIFGYQRAELDGVHLNILLHDHQKAPHGHYFSSMAKHGEGRMLNDCKPLKARGKDGKPVYILIGLRPHVFVDKNCGATVNCWMVHCVGVTELQMSKLSMQHAYTELAKNTSRIESMLQKRENMLRLLSHELRTSLSAVQYLVYEASQEEFPIQQQSSFILNELSDRLHAVASLSRHWLGEVEWKDTWAGAGGLFSQMVKKNWAIWANDVTELDFSTDIPASVELCLDWAKLEKVVSRCFRLCFKYTDRPPRKVIVRAAVSEACKDKAHFSLSFGTERCTQSHEVTQGDELPLAVDLSLVQEISEVFDPRYSVSTSEGCLVHYSIKAEFPSRGLVAQLPPTNSINLEGMTVLLVDDDKIIRKVVCAQMRKWGIKAITAMDGEDAIQAISNHQGLVDLVLMDLHMPVMDGFACTASLKASLADKCPRIVAFTAGGTDSDRVRAKDVGMDGFMLKPLNRDKFEEAVAVIQAG